MWEMQVLSTQRNNTKSEDISGLSLTSESSNEYNTAAESMETVPEANGDDHPALRGVHDGACAIIEASTSLPIGNGIHIAASSATASASNLTAVANSLGGTVPGRKRPLLAGGPRTSMTPTKRTVMSLLARARAAQAKQMPIAFQRGGGADRSTALVPLLREDYMAGTVNLNLL